MGDIQAAYIRITKVFQESPEGGEPVVAGLGAASASVRQPCQPFFNYGAAETFPTEFFRGDPPYALTLQKAKKLLSGMFSFFNKRYLHQFQNVKAHRLYIR